ncbi:MAG: hypothetical protein V4480_00665 [Patescibacteria group bacterium]
MVETDVSAPEAEDAFKFPVDVPALLEGENSNLEIAVTQALEVHGMLGGDLFGEDYHGSKLVIQILSADGKMIGSSDPFELHLDDYALKSPATFTFVREGAEPVTYEMAGFMTLRAILDEAGIVLAEGEKVFDDIDEIDLHQELDSGDGNATMYIRLTPPE